MVRFGLLFVVGFVVVVRDVLVYKVSLVGVCCDFVCDSIRRYLWWVTALCDLSVCLSCWVLL